MQLNFLKGKSFFIIPTHAFFLWRWLIIIVLGSIIYYKTLGFDFVFDDDWFIVTNVYLRDWHQIHHVFNKIAITRFLGIYSFALNYQPAP